MWNNSSSLPDSISPCDEPFQMLTIFLPCCVTRVLLILPMCIFVFYTSLLHWKPQRSCRSLSHSDFFTLNFAVMEVLSVLGFILYLSGTFCAPDVAVVGLLLYGLSCPGEVLIHSLIYLDRFLAVVFPITYLKQKQNVGIKTRNICVATVWAYSFVYDVVLYLYRGQYTTEMFTSLVIIASLVISICSGFILSVLIRPGPSDVEKVDKRKRKAFRTTTTSMVVVLIWFVGLILSLLVVNHLDQFPEYMCILSEVLLWFNMPCNIMLLALYVQRNRKCARRK